MSNKKDHVYDLPGAVAAAISSNRPELVNMLINQIKKGETLAPEHIIGCLEVIRDLTKYRHEDNQRALALGRYCRRLSDASKGIDKVEEKIREVTRKLGSCEPLEPDELE